MGFEPTTIRNLVECSTTKLLETVVSKGQIVGIDWNRIARPHSDVLAHMNSLTASGCPKSHLGLQFFRVYVSPRISVIS